MKVRRKSILRSQLFVLIVLCAMIFGAFRLEKEKELGALLINGGFAYFVLLVCLVPHEFGHAFAARVLGFFIHRIDLGLGDALWRKKIFGFDIRIGKSPAGGMTFIATDEMRFIRVRRILVMLAGPLVNIGLAVAVILAEQTWSFPGAFNFGIPEFSPAADFIYANLFIGVFNLLPFRLGTLHGGIGSDGHQILGLLFKAVSEQERRALQIVYYQFRYIEAHENLDVEAAKVWIQKAVDLYPDSVEIQNLEGCLAIEMSDLEKAFATFQRLSNHSDLSPLGRMMVRSNLAFTAALMGSESALSVVGSCMDDLHAFAEIERAGKHSLGFVLSVTTKSGVEHLLEAYVKSETRRQRAEGAAGLAKAFLNLGQSEKGEEFVRIARELDPTGHVLKCYGL